MENIQLIIGLGIGIVLGGIILWLYAKQKTVGVISENDFNSLKEELESVKTKLATEIEKSSYLDADLLKANNSVQEKEELIRSNTSEIATLKANLTSAEKNEALSISKLQETVEELDKQKNILSETKSDYSRLDAVYQSLVNELKSSKEEEGKLIEKLEIKTNQFNSSNEDLAKYKAENLSLVEKLATHKEEMGNDLKLAKDNIALLTKNLESKTEQFNSANEILATFKAENTSLQDKLATQKKEIAELGEKFNTEFTNIANKILEEKTQKFTNVNKESLETILKPLGENIDKFK
ncbi:MAG: hypothetical protein KAG37_03190, partial [Flavobacteriales bacterium]|nr:hypothetical protein [Flavobacteriales bacterium]